MAKIDYEIGVWFNTYVDEERQEGLKELVTELIRELEDKEDGEERLRHALRGWKEIELRRYK
jgi:hypothetical protein